MIRAAIALLVVAAFGLWVAYQLATEMRNNIATYSANVEHAAR